MYVYKIGYYSWEECPQRYLTHELKFEEDEFLQLLCGVLELVIREELAKPVEQYMRIHNFSDLFPDKIADYLVREKGFKDLPVHIGINVNGWANLHPTLSRWGSSTEPLEEPSMAFTRRLSETDLISQISDKNEEVDRWLDSYGTD